MGATKKRRKTLKNLNSGKFKKRLSKKRNKITYRR